MRRGNWFCVGVMSVVCAYVSVSCTGNGRRPDDQAIKKPENLMEEATLLRLYDEGEFIKAEIINPWDTASLLATYVLVERGAKPDSLPPGDVTVVEVPLVRSLVYSSVHAGVLNEMGVADAVAGVADGGYFKSEPYASRIDRGEIMDVGSSVSPSAEAILALGPDAVLVSPFENAGHGILDGAGVPVIECADYMEQTPKGRAEWVKFLGLLYGKGAEATSIYGQVVHDYDSIVSVVADSPDRPMVLTEMQTDGYWFVPGGKSYMSRLIQDAGAMYPWSNDGSTGSLQLDFSSVYAKAADADYWLIRSYGHDVSLSDLRSVYLLNSQFKAFKNGNVYVANTAEVPLFEEFPFHPEKMLEEYAKIFHPEAMGGKLKYFKRSF